jgi:hypothetical protein
MDVLYGGRSQEFKNQKDRMIEHPAVFGGASDFQIVRIARLARKNHTLGEAEADCGCS